MLRSFPLPLPGVAAVTILAIGMAGTVGAAPATASTATNNAQDKTTLLQLTDQNGNPTTLAKEGQEEFSSTAASLPENTVPLFSTQSSEVSNDIAVLTQPVETDEFFVAGVTWDAKDELAEDATVLIRVLEGKQWSEWTPLEVDEESNEERSGTEPYIAGSAEGVQVQVNGDDLPKDMQVSLIPSRPGEAEEVVQDAKEVEVASVTPTSDSVKTETAVVTSDQASISSSSTSTESTATSPYPNTKVLSSTPDSAAPRVISRAGWGANESQMKWRPSYYNLRAAVVHHTAGSNNYTQAQAAGVVRGIYYYHAVTRGWGDIGYNFLVDKWGRMYEGRSGSLNAPAGKMPQGAHASGFNSGTLGISVMGDYTKVNAPQSTINAMADIIAWKFGTAGIRNANEQSGYISPGTGYRAKGQNLPRIFVHRDVGATACPGNDIASKIPGLRTAVNNKLSNVKPVTPPPVSKPVTPANSYNFYLNTKFDSSSNILFSYGNRGEDVFVGDWDGDNKDTVATRDKSVFKVTNSNQTSSTPDKTFAYGRVGDDILVGDWDGDGIDTFAVRRGKEYHFKNSIAGGNADHVIHYGREGDDVLVGDWNGDGKDTLAVRRGREYHIKNSISGGNADRVIVYGHVTDNVVVGDWNASGSDTLGVRRGSDFHLRNSLTSGVADIRFAYGRVDDKIIVGDWTGSGRDTMGLWR